MIARLVMWFIAILLISSMGCAGPEVRIRDIQDYSREIQCKVESTSGESLRQTDMKVTISKPLSTVYRSVASALSNVGKGAFITPVSEIVPDTNLAIIIYSDREPIFHNKKPITLSLTTGKDNSAMITPITDLRIYVTIFMEGQGPEATNVYYYPHHRLCYNISPELMTVVDSNMDWRGRRFIYRLDTQAYSQEKWLWLSK